MYVKPKKISPTEEKQNSAAKKNLNILESLLVLAAMVFPPFQELPWIGFLPDDE